MQKKKRLQLVDFARILMAISITLLFYGIFLDIQDSKKLVDPVKDTTIINGNENQVSITPSDGNEVIGTNDNVNANINSNTNNQDNLSIDEVNDKLRKQIENKYNISIKYGSETANYYVKSGTTVISTSPIENANVINNQLHYLNDTLGQYPDGLFKEIKNGGIPLTILLIDSYSEQSITGVTDSTYDYANISIAAMYSFNESFYHESYHYIERYMFKKGANFNSWDSLNPSDFNWNTIDGNLSYSNTFSENSWFVNNYAQTAAAEDRASTFEYMMASSKASCLNNGTNIWKKANYMAQMIRQVLNSVKKSSNVRWEQYLY